MSSPKRSTRSPSKKGLREEHKGPNKSWLDSLYEPNLFSETELKAIYDNAKFKGFNRDVMLEKLEQATGNTKIAAEAIIVCALRGPKKAADIKLQNGKTLQEIGIPASGTQGTEDLSCNRIAAATADLAAYYLKKLNYPKRIDVELVGWLQFPTAGSIKLPTKLRQQHVEFSKRFSPMIGGVFNEQIYSQMVENSYLSPKLKLFE